jgi:hypothetical protein
LIKILEEIPWNVLAETNVCVFLSKKISIDLTWSNMYWLLKVIFEKTFNLTAIFQLDSYYRIHCTFTVRKKTLAKRITFLTLFCYCDKHSFYWACSDHFLIVTFNIFWGRFRQILELWRLLDQTFFLMFCTLKFRALNTKKN